MALVVLFAARGGSRDSHSSDRSTSELDSLLHRRQRALATAQQSSTLVTGGGGGVAPHPAYQPQRKVSRFQTTTSTLVNMSTFRPSNYEPDAADTELGSVRAPHSTPVSQHRLQMTSTPVADPLNVSQGSSRVDMV